MNKRIKVAISHGDINGINYEILYKLFEDDRILELFTPIIYGSVKAAEHWYEVLKVEGTRWHKINQPEDARDGVVSIIDCSGNHHVEVTSGQPTALAGELAYEALARAVKDVKAHRADVLVTGPINKSTMPRDRFPYAGHTQYLEAEASTEGGSLMILCSGDTRVALATGHIPVSEVANQLTEERIISRCIVLEEGLKRDFSITKPRIAILGLNPHAGDNGLIGDDEQQVITPAIQELHQRGIIAFGPYPADGLWGSGRYDSFDAVLAMYHDQGLAPFKALHMSEGVNATLGLSIVRTSPDHGTGYDIAGQGIASPDSMRHAIYQAIDMLRARRAWEQANRNPLRRIYHNRGRDDERLDLSGE